MSGDPKPSGWSSFYRGEGDRAVRAMFGRTLRELFEVPRQMPQQLLVILMQLNEGKVDGPPPDDESAH
jgi:hypothetical protein